MTLYAPGKTRPPWPSEWPRPVTARQIRVVLGGLGLTSFLLLTGTLATWDGDSRGPLILLWAPILAAFTVRAAASKLRGRRHRASAIRSAEVPALQQTALVIRYSGVQSLAYLVGIVTLTPAILALSALFLAVGLSDFPHYWSALLMGVVMLLLAGGLILIIIHIARRRLWRGLVALEPKGIYHRAWAYEMYLPWEAVFNVKPMVVGDELYVMVSAKPHPQARYRQISRCWKQDEFNFQPHLALPVQAFPVDPAVLLTLVTYYATHPVYRVELSDDRAVHRAHRQNVNVQVH